MYFDYVVSNSFWCGGWVFIWEGIWFFECDEWFDFPVYDDSCFVYVDGSDCFYFIFVVIVDVAVKDWCYFTYSDLLWCWVSTCPECCSVD